MVIVITGIMAAGKSTVAQILAERLPRSVHVRGDVFRRMIISGRAEPTPSGSAERRPSSPCATSFPRRPRTFMPRPASPRSCRTSSWGTTSPRTFG